MSQLIKGFVVLIVISIALLLPIINLEVMPKSDLEVVDENGKLLQSISIQQEWKYLSFESEYHRESKISDVDGRVTFESREIRLNAATFLSGKALEQFAFLNPHSGSGPFCSFTASNSKSFAPLFREGHEVPTELFVY